MELPQHMLRTKSDVKGVFIDDLIQSMESYDSPLIALAEGI
jgi:hypothetical protein